MHKPHTQRTHTTTTTVAAIDCTPMACRYRSYRATLDGAATSIQRIVRGGRDRHRARLLRQRMEAARQKDAQAKAAREATALAAMREREDLRQQVAALRAEVARLKQTAAHSAECARVAAAAAKSAVAAVQAAAVRAAQSVYHHPGQGEPSVPGPNLSHSSCADAECEDGEGGELGRTVDGRQSHALVGGTPPADSASHSVSSLSQES